MGIKQLVDELKLTKSIVETPIIGDQRTRAGREMARNQASSRIPVLEAALVTEFQKVGYPIFVNGSASNEFVRLAKQEAECVQVDIPTVLAGVYGAVDLSYGNHSTFSVQQHSILLREARQIGVEVGLRSIPDMGYITEEYVASPADRIAVVDKYLAGDVSKEVLAPWIVRKAAFEAVNLLDEAPVIPVLITNISDTLIQSVGPYLFAGNFQSFNGDKVSSKDVVAVFKEIKKFLSKDKKAAPQPVAQKEEQTQNDEE